MLRGVQAVLMAALVVTPVVAVAQNYALPGGTRDFRVEWETPRTARGKAILGGYVYNDQGTAVDRVQLLIEAVDASGSVTGSSTAYVSGVVPAGNRRYFEVPATVAPAASYRVRVVTYELVGRGT